MFMLQQWNRRYLLVAVVCCALVAFVAATPRLFADTEVIYLADTSTLRNHNRGSYVAAFLCVLTIILSTTLICSVLEIRALRIYRSLPLSIRRSCKDDWRLLVYAFSQLAVQVPMAVDYAILVIAPASDAAMFCSTIYPYLNNALSLGSSVCLMVTSKLVRHSYVEFYFCGYHLKVEEVTRVTSMTNNS
ncbi:hypothetical protein AAVH_40549 [Aphelenchoides avenae]|nr:hypothetical protein AAVH_40549 [Aphelenchus avenae]